MASIKSKRFISLAEAIEKGVADSETGKRFTYETKDSENQVIHLNVIAKQYGIPSAVGIRSENN